MGCVYGIEYFSGDSNSWDATQFFSTQQLAFTAAKVLSLQLSEWYDHDHIRVGAYPLNTYKVVDPICEEDSIIVKDGEVQYANT